jgi:cytochrome c oxidase subunit 4
VTGEGNRPVTSVPASDRERSGASGHPGHHSVATYAKIAVILTVVTALEFGVIYIRRLTPVRVPLLLAMSLFKFALVVMFFMHLRYDARSLSLLFVGPLIIATILVVVLMTLPEAFLLFGR